MGADVPSIRRFIGEFGGLGRPVLVAVELLVIHREMGQGGDSWLEDCFGFG